ncbi:MAG: hypothetical protein HXY35_06560 [Chloroflexi bacterium]|nr:hypothetical protein [Chloroflexota bacterium]
MSTHILSLTHMRFTRDFGLTPLKKPDPRGRVEAGASAGAEEACGRDRKRAKFKVRKSGIGNGANPSPTSKKPEVL